MRSKIDYERMNGDADIETRHDAKHPHIWCRIQCMQSWDERLPRKALVAVTRMTLGDPRHRRHPPWTGPGKI
jgi:hypothetical protein